jgi:hypothetical protein
MKVIDKVALEREMQVLKELHFLIDQIRPALLLRIQTEHIATDYIENDTIINAKNFIIKTCNETIKEKLHL